MIDPLVSYFGPRTHETTIIDGTHPGSSTTRTVAEQYIDNRKSKTVTLVISILLAPLLTFQNSNATHLLFKLRDFLSVFEWTFRSKRRYDLFIGLESVYTVAGIFLRWLGFVKKVVYYVSDYSPNRYENRYLNNFYLSLDRFCSTRADVVWDVSAAIMKARMKAGCKKSSSVRYLVVPNALYPSQITMKPLNQTVPYSLVFAGTLGPENGPAIAIRALPLVRKQFPKTVLHIFGGNDQFEQSLRDLVSELNLLRHVVFHGFISDQHTLSTLISNYRLALAPYAAIPGSPRWYADATKIRLYMGAGLPVITTRVPPLGTQIVAAHAGIVTDDTPKTVAREIIRLFNNPSAYSRLRNNTIMFAKNNTWEHTYTAATAHLV